ncbi:hypothetical protein CEXT_588251 [Caerostris extrusa]|uniref:Uncharacterized protein n=1 Tax=Caerostris extrusa TaxID=172846 RepID=A0AAV4Q875_CAEEX|nr:hypothetical protein CEXT_588251 [Caerostris extrusa]
MAGSPFRFRTEKASTLNFEQLFARHRDMYICRQVLPEHKQAMKSYATPRIYQTSIHLGNTESVETRSCIFNIDGRYISRRFSSAPEPFPVPKKKKHKERTQEEIRQIYAHFSPET